MAKIKKKSVEKVTVVKKIEENVVVLPPKRMSDDPTPKQVKWINRQRVLVFAARGINHRHRHLMEDIKKLMPHHKTESKMERSKNLYVVNEISEAKNCNKCILFEGRKMRDLYLWMANVPNGPSVKFYVENIYTMGELKMTGNCLRASRPLLSFDPQFSKHPHYELLKELLIQIFGVPYHHPKSQPFFDHVYTFMVLDNRIWFRNYQILSEDGALAEIGPRFVLNPVKIFSGSFGGTTLWENPKYVSPAKLRQAFSKKAANKYQNRIEKKAIYEATRPETAYPDYQDNTVFLNNPDVTECRSLAQRIAEEDELFRQAKAAMEAEKDEPDEEMDEGEETKVDESAEDTGESEEEMEQSEEKTDHDDDESEIPVKPVIQKKNKFKPEKTIRRKQLNAKTKQISDQIKKRRQNKKKKPVKRMK